MNSETPFKSHMRTLLRKLKDEYPSLQERIVIAFNESKKEFADSLCVFPSPTLFYSCFYMEENDLKDYSEALRRTSPDWKKINRLTA